MEKREINFVDIVKVNESIKTTDIKGKDYAEVNQRIKAFKMLYPEGTIVTKMKSNENGVCVFRAYVYDEEQKLLATGTAYEKENSTFINKTSYIENCETSAIGRALGIAGFGIDTSIASAEEVQNAIVNQEKENDETKKLDYRALLEAFIQDNNLDKVEVCKKYKLNARSKAEAFRTTYLSLIDEINQSKEDEEKEKMDNAS